MFDDLYPITEMNGDSTDYSFRQSAEFSRRIVNHFNLIRRDSTALQLRWFGARFLDAHDAVDHDFRVLDDVQRAPLRLDEHGVHAE